jgi:hypothetical protein
VDREAFWNGVEHLVVLVNAALVGDADFFHLAVAVRSDALERVQLMFERVDARERVVGRNVPHVDEGFDPADADQLQNMVHLGVLLPLAVSVVRRLCQLLFRQVVHQVFDAQVHRFRVLANFLAVGVDGVRRDFTHHPVNVLELVVQGRQPQLFPHFQRQRRRYVMEQLGDLVEIGYAPTLDVSDVPQHVPLLPLQLVEMRVVDRPQLDFTRGPAEGRVATRAEHLVAPVDLEDALPARRTWLRFLFDQLGAQLVRLLAHVGRISRRAQHVHAVAAGELVAQRTLVRGGQKPFAGLARARHDELLLDVGDDGDPVVQIVSKVGRNFLPPHQVAVGRDGAVVLSDFFTASMDAVGVVHVLVGQPAPLPFCLCERNGFGHFTQLFVQHGLNVVGFELVHHPRTVQIVY